MEALRLQALLYHLVLETDMSQIAPQDKPTALESAAEVIRRRWERVTGEAAALLD